MKVMVPLLVAALVCTSVSGDCAEKSAAQSTGDASLRDGRLSSNARDGGDSPRLRGDSNMQLEQTEGDGALGEFDMLIPVQVNSMWQTRGGTFLQFEFQTTAPTAAMICLSKSWIEPVQAADGSWSVAGSVERLGFSGINVNHSVAVKDLDPDSVYFVVILFDPPPQYAIAGTKPYHWVDTTLKRRVSVSIVFLYMIDDSDDLSAGDLLFNFQIGSPSADFWHAGNSWDHFEKPASGRLQIDSGDGIWPGIHMHALGVGDAVKLTACCNDADAKYTGGLNVPDVYKGTGCNENAEWNSDGWTFDISGGTEMSTGLTLWDREEYGFDFVKTVDESDVSSLEYQVWGSVHVSYE
ncbi:MAG: hypothetical protein RIC55_25440 [Pirellulaceae bacterium]